MIKGALIFFITLILISCNIKTQQLDTSQDYFDKKNSSSYAGNYLTANYSIMKGDAYTASRILENNSNNLKLLEIKFFSNLISGNFYTADKVPQKLRDSGKNNTLYDLPQYILKMKSNNIRGSLKVFKNQKLFFNLYDLNNLIKFWIKLTENTEKFLSEKHYINSSIHELLILENFYSSGKLIKIADAILKKDKLNSHELLLLAGFYFRVDSFEKSKEIIKTKLPSQFDKKR